ncbi:MULTISPECIES: hypothetical protein [unclassified Mycobacterium]|uniref:hypothetical protein n=1 Tax=unclassified Mycobacterium TaxID=2642494 RepID=UPI00274120BF|nr:MULTISPECIES: hypothetical protein [unclassified Mycobacterium]MDP7706208.1 hypothetical protein [Mycobacterium sp. TY815]MDP7726022.1 hypothetical protein [Mycobacterium sp. TY814]
MDSESDPPEEGKTEDGPAEGRGTEESKPAETKPEPGKPAADRPRRSSLGANRPFKDAPDKPDTPLLKPLGSIQFQDAATTKPRPPTPAELRARRKHEDKQRELEEARQAAEAKRQKQKRILMGSAAAVGVVGLVAGVGYWLLRPDNVTAQCVQDDPSGQPVIVPDSYCTGHTPGMNGFFFWGGHSYRYYYGSSGSVGQRPIGGSTSIPKGANVTTKSGTTIQRGGIGGSGGKGGGGS